MSTISCTIRGNSVSLLTDVTGAMIGTGASQGMPGGGGASTAVPTMQAAVEVRDILKFTVIDASGLAVYYRGDPVTLTDSISGVLYDGYVQTSDPMKVSPDPNSTTILHTITCMDNQYLFDKRTNNQNYLNWYAGDIAVDLVHRIGAAEGVTVAAALDHDSTQAEWAAGTLAGTVATSNVGDGDLELVLAGSAVTVTEATTSDFAAGTLSNVVAANNSLMPTTQSAILLSSVLAFTIADGFAYVQIWSGSMTVGTLDTLHYDIWFPSTAKSLAGVDLLFSDGTRLKDTVGIYDQNGIGANPTNDISAFATNTWYSRNIAFTAALNGKVVKAVYIGFESNSVGTFSAYIKNVYLLSSIGSPYFGTSATVTQTNPPVVISVAGYSVSQTSAKIVQVFDPQNNSRISTAHSIAAVALLRSSFISWVGIVPGSGLVNIAASYDGGVTYQPCVNNAALPALPAGSNMTGLSLVLKESFGTTGSDPTLLPTLTGVTVNLQPAASATKSDVVTPFATQAAWNTGTYAGLQGPANGDLTTGTTSQNWTAGTTTGQTFFQTGGASQSVTSGKYQLTVPLSLASNNWGTSRLDFAGTLLDFTLDVDMTNSDTYNYSSYATVFYRTLYWDNSMTFWNGGYFVWFTQNAMELGYGTNAPSIPAAWKILANVPGTYNAGTTYHLTIVVNGSRHTVYLNHSSSPIIDIIDATIAAPGQIGLHGLTFLQNPGGGGNAIFTFDNLVIVPNAAGSWTGPSTSISSLGTCGPSVISWTELGTANPSVASAIIQSSIDGGSTYQTCTNGGAIPNLTPGSSVAGKSVKLLITLATLSDLFVPVVRQLVWRVLGAYPGSTGTRVSPVLSLTPAGRAGSTSVSWNATLPTGTSLVVATSPDNITYTTIAASGNPIASIYSQPAPQIDVWTTNTLANYTNTFKSGGSVATVTYDTTNSRLTLANGSGALYLFTAISRADIDMIIDMDRSDAGGIVWRRVDASNFYELGVYDDTASGGFTNQLRLYKVAANVRTLLGLASVIAFPRATAGKSPYHRIRVTMAGGVITVYYDGIQVQTYTDGSPLAAGQCGIRNDGGTSRYYQLRIQPLGDDMTGKNLYTRVTLATTDPSVMPQLLDLEASVRGPSIATGALIPQLHDPSKPFVEFLNKEMDTITTASGDYYWNINQGAGLTFNERHANPAPWCLHSTDLIYEAQVTPTSTADLYRNRQNITDCVGVTALLHEQWITDGTASSWKTQNPVYSAPLITVQGIAQSVGVQSVDTNKQFYWTANSTSIGQDTSATKLPAGFLIDIYYVGQFVTTVTVDNGAEQTARAIVEVGTTGIIEASESKPGMLATLATTYAQGLNARYGLNNAVQVIGTTKRAGVVAGMMLPVFIPEHQLNNAQMLVTQVATTMQQQADGSVLYFYGITATQGANLANWTKVFNF